jgi:hypothetical protein
MKNGLSGISDFCWPTPCDRLVRQVLGQVVALLRRLRWVDRRDPLVQRRAVLVGLRRDEAVEVLEAAARRPAIEGTHRARLPDRNLVALADLGRAVAIELHRFGQRRGGVRADRVVARSGRGDVRDRAHAHRVVVAPGEQRLTRGRAQRRRVKAVELQPLLGEPLERRRAARTAKRARRPEAGVVEHDHEHVRRPRGRLHRLDRRVGRIRVLRVVCRQADVVAVRDRQNRTRDIRRRQWLPIPSG